MKWTAHDKSQVTNLIIALKKGKFEMTGMEIVAFADVFRWVSSLHDHIERELAPKPPVILTPNSVSPQLNAMASAPPTDIKPSAKAKKNKKNKDEKVDEP